VFFVTAYSPNIIWMLCNSIKEYNNLTCIVQSLKVFMNRCFHKNSETAIVQTSEMANENAKIKKSRGTIGAYRMEHCGKWKKAIPQQFP
jgi:hypothetical protein